MGLTVAGGRFVLETRLGEGGQAAVFRVRDQRLGVQRALKVLQPRYAAKPKIRARFATEARSMALLEHKNIVRVYDVQTEGVLPYMVMELLPGGSLAQWLESIGSFPPRQAIAIAIDICEGLSAAHAAHIIHRDIKPQNILIAADGTCKVTDFGIARTEEGNLTRVGASLGTHGYMAPEQSRDASTVDVRSDVYSVAITLFVMLTAHDPIEWITGRYRDWIPGPLLPVLDRATADDPANRHPTIDHLASHLRAVIPRLPPDANALPLGTRPGGGTPAPARYDFADLTPILDADRETMAPSGGHDGIYQRPNPAPNTPPWIDRNQQAALPKPFVVGLHTVEEEMSHHARHRRERVRQGLPAEVTTQADTSRWDVVLWNLGRALMHPFRMIPVVLTIGGVFGTWAAERNWAARHAVQQAVDSRGKLHRALEAEQPLIEALSGLGADTGELTGLYARWRVAHEPDRSALAVQIVDGLDQLSEKVAQPGRPAWESAHREIRKLRVAKDQFRATSDAATASAESRWVVGVEAP